MAATEHKAIPEGAWTEVTDASCLFQVTSRDSIKITEAATLPTDQSEYKLALYGEMYSFTADSTKLYAYSDGEPARVAFEAV